MKFNQKDVNKWYDKEKDWFYNFGLFTVFWGKEQLFRTKTIEELQLKKDDKLLDVACGNGKNFLPIREASSCPVTAIDFNENMLQMATSNVRKLKIANVKLKKANASNLPFSDNSYDCALCTLGLSVIPKWKETLNEIHRVVKPNGRIAIMDGGLFKGVLKVFNSYVRLLSYIAKAEADRNIKVEFKKYVSNFKEGSFLGGSIYLLSGNNI